MKSRFTTIDIMAVVAEIKKSAAMGLRVLNIYDIDSKTYLVRLAHGDVKRVVLIESGYRIHLTDYDWPKNMMPSGFSMKCRKHLKGRRLSSIEQLGVDRIIDMTFGYDEAAYHLIVELYDRGNIVLTDYEYTILQLLRVRTDNKDSDVKFAVREKYPIHLARQPKPLMSPEQLKEVLEASKPSDNLKRVLNPLFIFGASVLEHCLSEEASSQKVSQFNWRDDQEMSKLMASLQKAEKILEDVSLSQNQGCIIQKKDKGSEDILTYFEFHPLLFRQHSTMDHINFPNFNKAVDEFFSKLESQKIDMKAAQQEKAALKRLENVRTDHEKRLTDLKLAQDDDMRKAELIEVNLPLIEQAIAVVNSAIANQMDWEEIEEIVCEAREQGDPVAGIIRSLQLDTNHVTVALSDPFSGATSSEDESDSEENENAHKKSPEKLYNVSIDLSLTAFANARNFHNKRRNAANKEQKTMQASKKALKSAEQKTKETLKEVQTTKLINKTRKTYWFEKFYWFISSENYLVIGGRDQQQNELIVKRYLGAGDLYVHADLHGASSVVIKNRGGNAAAVVPPKTLNEAGTMAICYSAAWEARVVTSAWWVHHNQVSKTAPSGEYLTTGSFMIRGKKNYLPPTYLVMGYSVLFKLDESCVGRHAQDRRVKRNEDDDVVQKLEDLSVDTEIELNEEDENKQQNTLEINTTDSSPEREIKKISSDSQDKICKDRSNSEKETSEQHFSLENNSNKEYNVKYEEIIASPDELRDIVTSPEENMTSPEENIASPEKNMTSPEENIASPEKNMTSPEENITSPEEDIRTTKGDEQGTANDVKEGSKKECLFPDTRIQLQHVEGGKYELQRAVSDSVKFDDDQKYIELADGQKLQLVKQEPKNRKPVMSAKMRRDLKKKGRAVENTEEVEERLQKEIPKQQQKKTDTEATQQSKKRSKAKQKKMEKYKDQDEEDKLLFQQILKSDGATKPPKKKGKEKQPPSQQTNKAKKQNKPPLPLQDDIIHLPEDAAESKAKVIALEADLDDEAEKVQQSVEVVDSLTGCPFDDDVLLYAIPYCAPYTCMQNHKFKVKLTPGAGKRGKAAKTALQSFTASKDTREWERDLLKCLKDTDLSRNIPGKVKVSAPNLHRNKKK